MAMATGGHLMRSPLATPNDYFSPPSVTSACLRSRPRQEWSRSTTTSGNAASNATMNAQSPTTLQVRTNRSPEPTVNRETFSTSNDGDIRSHLSRDHEQQQQRRKRMPSKLAPEDQRQVPYVNVLGLSTVDQSRMLTARERVIAGGFYHGQLSASEACRVLAPHPIGTFLIRDSSERDLYPFTITVRIESPSVVATSIRIVYKTGLFRLDGLPETAALLPSFQCILELIRHHVRMRPDSAAGGSNKRSDITFVGCSSTINNETSTLPVVLRKPLPVSRSPSTLKHLCRRRINGLLDGRNASRLYLTPSLKQYLADYPSDL